MSIVLPTSPSYMSRVVAYTSHTVLQFHVMISAQHSSVPTLCNEAMDSADHFSDDEDKEEAEEVHVQGQGAMHALLGLRWKSRSCTLCEHTLPPDLAPRCSQNCHSSQLSMDTIAFILVTFVGLFSLSRA